nr:MFS transporter [Pseudoclavibacter sp. 13-3]
MRGAATILSPIIELVNQDVELDTVMQGVIGALPQLLFAGAGLVTPLLVRCMSLPVLAAAAMVVTAGAQMLRASVHSDLAFGLSTGLIFLAIGVGNIVAPPTIKLFFPRRVGMMTSAYSITLGLSTAVPPIYIVALSHAAGWRVGLASWAVPALLAALLWGVVILTSRRNVRRPETSVEKAPPAMRETAAGGTITDGPDPAPAGRIPEASVQMWRTWQGWGIAVMMAAQSTVVYAMFAWLPALLRDAGVDAASAAFGLSLFTALGILLGVVIPPMTSRQATLRPLLAVSTVCFAVGLIGLMVSPGHLPMLWVAALGLGPLTFCMVLVLIPLRARTQMHASQLSAFVQGVGYLIAAAGPFLFGLLHELSGGWMLPLAYLLVCVAISLPFAVIGTRPGYVGDAVRR